MSVPPKLARRFLRWFLREDLAEEVEGDLEEQFVLRSQEGSLLKARMRYWYEVFRYFRPFAIRKKTPTPTIYTPMLSTYFKIGWRNLLKYKGYSFINISGLALGLTVVMLIGLWIFDELSFNKYHSNYHSIAKVMRLQLGHGMHHVNSAHTTGLGTLLSTEYETYFKNVVMVRARIEERVIAAGSHQFTQLGYFMQPEGPEMFGLNMKYGVHDGLMDMNSILLSESLAIKLFGDRDPVNEIVKMDARWDLKVTGVYEDLPKNSEFAAASYLASLDRYLNGWATLHDWDNFHMYVYAQIHPGVEFDQASAVIENVMNQDFLLNVVPEQLRDRIPEFRHQLFLHPMSKWHLNSKFENGVNVMSEELKFVWFYGIIGVFVLILACINYMNLCTARSERRAREMGVRKTIGSRRIQLIQQFFSESLLTTALALVLSLLVLVLVLPWFNQVAAKDISIQWWDPWIWLAGLGFTLLTGLLAGTYPALYLSSFNPVKALKGSFRPGRYSSLPRKVLVVVQFTVSVSLIIGTVLVYQQIQYAKHRLVGYSREGLITIRPKSPEFSGKYQVLRSELKKTGVVEEIAECNYAITSTLGWNGGFQWDDMPPGFDESFNTNWVTHEYGKTVGWEFIDGRDFSREFSTDKNGLIINESAAKLMGLTKPVGTLLHWEPNWREPGDYQILGVVRDMVKGSPFQSTDPSIIFLSETDLEWLFIRLNPSVSAGEALPRIEAVFKELIPSAPFDYSFVDQEYALKFAAEERVGTLASGFAAIAIFISCLGLFGLASFVVEQRTKEIGIRKILGASLASLWKLLSKEFAILIVISCFIAIPIAYTFLQEWLQKYQYRIEVSWLVFVITCFVVLVITVLTVSHQTIRVSLMNPVKTLRSE